VKCAKDLADFIQEQCHWKVHRALRPIAHPPPNAFARKLLARRTGILLVNLPALPIAESVLLSTQASTARPRLDWAHPCHFCAGTGLAAATSAPGLGSPMRQALRHEGLDTGAKLARNFIEVERGPQRNVFACVRCAPPDPMHMRHACAGGAGCCAYSSQ